MLLHGTYPQKCSRAGKDCGSLRLVQGEGGCPPPLWQRGDVVRYRPFTTTIWVALGMERMGWH